MSRGNILLITCSTPTVWDMPAYPSVRDPVGERFSFMDRLFVGWRTKKWQGYCCCFNLTLDVGLLILVELVIIWSLPGMRGGDTILHFILNNKLEWHIMDIVFLLYSCGSAYFSGIFLSESIGLFLLQQPSFPSLVLFISSDFEQLYKIIMDFFSSWLAVIENEDWKVY